MVSFRICRKCQYGEYHEEEYDGEGRMVVRPSVHCSKSEQELLMNQDPPDGCPYSLEHQLVCQDIPKKFANMVSGGPPIKTGDEL